MAAVRIFFWSALDNLVRYFLILSLIVSELLLSSVLSCLEALETLRLALVTTLRMAASSATVKYFLWLLEAEVALLLEADFLALDGLLLA